MNEQRRNDKCVSWRYGSTCGLSPKQQQQQRKSLTICFFFVFLFLRRSFFTFSNIYFVGIAATFTDGPPQTARRSQWLWLWLLSCSNEWKWNEPERKYSVSGGGCCCCGCHLMCMNMRPDCSKANQQLYLLLCVDLEFWSRLISLSERKKKKRKKINEIMTWFSFCLFFFSVVCKSAHKQVCPSRPYVIATNGQWPSMQWPKTMSTMRSSTFHSFLLKLFPIRIHSIHSSLNLTYSFYHSHSRNDKLNANTLLNLKWTRGEVVCVVCRIYKVQNVWFGIQPFAQMLKCMTTLIECRDNNIIIVGICRWFASCYNCYCYCWRCLQCVRWIAGVCLYIHYAIRYCTTHND